MADAQRLVAERDALRTFADVTDAQQAAAGGARGPRGQPTSASRRASSRCAAGCGWTTGASRSAPCCSATAWSVKALQRERGVRRPPPPPAARARPLEPADPASLQSPHPMSSLIVLLPAAARQRADRVRLRADARRPQRRRPRQRAGRAAAAADRRRRRGGGGGAGRRAVLAPGRAAQGHVGRFAAPARGARRPAGRPAARRTGDPALRRCSRGAAPGAPVWVAVCDRAWLRSALQALEAAGGRSSRIVPEFAPEGAPALYALGEPAAAASLVADRQPTACCRCRCRAARWPLLPALPEDTPLAGRARGGGAGRTGAAAPARCCSRRRSAGCRRPSRAGTWRSSNSPAPAGPAPSRRLATGWADVLRAPQWRPARWGRRAAGGGQPGRPERLGLEGALGAGGQARSGAPHADPDLPAGQGGGGRAGADGTGSRARCARPRARTSGRDLEAMLGALAPRRRPSARSTALEFSGGELRVKRPGAAARRSAQPWPSACKSQGYSRDDAGRHAGLSAEDAAMKPPAAHVARPLAAPGAAREDAGGRRGARWSASRCSGGRYWRPRWPRCAAPTRSTARWTRSCSACAACRRRPRRCSRSRKPELRRGPAPARSCRCASGWAPRARMVDRRRTRHAHAGRHRRPTRWRSG